MRDGGEEEAGVTNARVKGGPEMYAADGITVTRRTGLREAEKKGISMG
jgi:hypothetical protein